MRQRLIPLVHYYLLAEIVVDGASVELLHGFRLLACQIGVVYEAVVVQFLHEYAILQLLVFSVKHLLERHELGLLAFLVERASKQFIFLLRVVVVDWDVDVSEKLNDCLLVQGRLALIGIRQTL